MQLLREIRWPKRPTVTMMLIAGTPAIIAWWYPGVLAPFLLSVVLTLRAGSLLGRVISSGGRTSGSGGARS